MKLNYSYIKHPYGMLMPGRHEQAENGYRYGFQGQEGDDEVKGKGNSVNYKYRMHDSRIGRFFAIDPLAAKYSYNSPYAFSENSTIAFIELEGLEKVSYTITMETGTRYEENWYSWVPFSDYQNYIGYLTGEASVSNIKVENAKSLYYRITLKVPNSYYLSGTEAKPQYFTTFVFEGNDLADALDPENWIQQSDPLKALREGFVSGFTVGSMDYVLEMAVGTFTNKVLSSSAWQSARIAYMKTWIDNATGKLFRNHEILGAFDFEKKFGIFLKASSGKGDFMGLVGKYKNKVFDHFGTTLKGAQQSKFMTQFKNSVDKHFSKLSDGVDYLMLDFKNMSKEQMSGIKTYIKEKYADKADKIFYLND